MIVGHEIEIYLIEGRGWTGRCSCGDLFELPGRYTGRRYEVEAWAKQHRQDLREAR